MFTTTTTSSWVAVPMTAVLGVLSLADRGLPVGSDVLRALTSCGSDADGRRLLSLPDARTVHACLSQAAAFVATETERASLDGDRGFDDRRELRRLAADAQLVSSLSLQIAQAIDDAAGLDTPRDISTAHAVRVRTSVYDDAKLVDRKSAETTGVLDEVLPRVLGERLQDWALDQVLAQVRAARPAPGDAVFFEAWLGDSYQLEMTVEEVGREAGSRPSVVWLELTAPVPSGAAA